MEEQGRKPIDKLAKRGHLKKGDLPGTDTFDDGMDETGKVLMPGSITVASGGTYMEEAGPNDLVHRAKMTDEASAEQSGLSLQKSLSVTDEQKGDEADKWLQANDPERQRPSA